MATGTVLLGINAALYVGAKGAAATTAMKNARGVSLKLGTATADVTYRGGGAIELSVSALRQVEISWKMLDIDGDADLALVVGAYVSQEPVSIKCLDKESGKGVDGDFIIVTADRNEDDKGVVEHSITAKPTLGRKLTFPGFDSSAGDA